MGRKRSFPPSIAASLMEGALVPALHRELHDQDGVFAQEADQHDHPELRPNVVRQADGGQEQERAEDADRQREDDGQGNQEALILRHEHEVDEDHHDDEDVECRVALLRLVPRQAFPAEGIAARQGGGGDLLHRIDGLTGGITRGRHELNGGRGVEVVARDLVQALRLLQLHESRVGDHLAL